MKKVSYVYNVLFLGAAIFFFLQYKKSQINLDYFQFDYRPPKFSDRENKIIRSTFPVIMEKLDAPANYYVCSVKEEKNKITVSVMPLQALQAGVDSKTRKGMVIYDGAIEFIFDGENHFLEKKRTLNFPHPDLGGSRVNCGAKNLRL